MHPDASVREVGTKQLNGLPNRPKPHVAASTHMSSEQRGAREEVFGSVNLFLRPEPSPSWVLRFQGTNVLELAE